MRRQDFWNLTKEKNINKETVIETHTDKSIYDFIETNDELGKFYYKDTGFGRLLPHEDPIPSKLYQLWGPLPDNRLVDDALSSAAGLNWNYDDSPLDIFREGKCRSFTGEAYTFKSIEEATKHVKRAADFYGASDVGICKYDETFMYEENIEEFKKLNFKPRSVIVIAIAMDKDGISLKTQKLAAASTALGYSHMAEVGAKIAMFISGLGYNSYSGGNRKGMAVPYAISAGLGEASRMGTIIHPKLGTAFRIAKIYTELELAVDSPITFGVEEKCNNCRICVDNCPAKAIEFGEKKFADGSSISNRKGIKKWANSAEKCLIFWGENKNDCSKCLASCPYFGKRNL